jgi:hypothetical protein
MSGLLFESLEHNGDVAYDRTGPGSFFGALWPDEQAWKLRVEIHQPGDKDSEDEIVAVAEFLAKPEQVRSDLTPTGPKGRD